MIIQFSSIATVPYVGLISTPEGRHIRADVRAATPGEAMDLIRRSLPAGARLVAVAPARPRLV